jgi:hypothetical protein
MEDMANLENINELQGMMGEMSSGGGDSSIFMLGILFGIIGMFYFYYGKKEDDRELFYYSGIGLMVFPYIVEGRNEMIVVGILISIIPFVIKK